MFSIGFGRDGEIQTVPTPAECDDSGIVDRVPAEPRYAGSRWGYREWRRFLLFGQRPAPVPSYHGFVEPPEQGKVGIACSGGGIRSAAFSLGALQRLQQDGVLQKSHYLAGVSGGSYIAAAFCMLRKRRSGDEPAGDGDDSDPRVVTDAHPPFFPGSPEEQYLRNRSSYMAPGLLGKLNLAYRLILGMTINLGFIALAVVTLAIAMAMIYGGLYPELTKHLDSNGTCGGHSCNFAPLPQDASIWIPIAAVGACGLMLGLVSILFYRMRPWLGDLTETWSKRLLLAAAAGGVVFIGIPTLLALVRELGVNHDALNPAATETPAAPTAAITAGGIATAGTAVLAELRAEWVRVQKLAKKGKAAAKWYQGLGVKVRRLFAYAVAAVIGPALLLFLMLMAMSTTLNIVHPYVRWIVLGVAVAIFTVVYARADLNTWSLHPFYRRRLCSAFALKRVSRPEGTPPIAEDDAGIAVERDYHRLVCLSKTKIDPGPNGKREWPTLLVCAAANVSDDAATPPGRAVTSFTFSPRALGGALVGAVKTEELESGLDTRRLSYFTLPAAVAMSGAAISPSMGKMTKRPLTFLLALANVRLGVWVPNPRRLQEFGGRFFPRPRPFYLLRELFGSSPINAPFLYVTDGGHYENLGIVELLRRGCTQIYAFDASNDVRCETLGDAISLARSELGVQIDIACDNVIPDGKSKLAASDCVTGDIRFPGDSAPAGKLYYARPVMTSKAPSDVKAYHEKDKRFPHDPTGDQLYTDQRFEAYRALGALAGQHALEARAVPTVGTGAEPVTA
jgi:hypothetical protein